MNKKKYKGKVTKLVLSKSNQEVVKVYHDLEYQYAKQLEEDEEVLCFETHVAITEDYTTDFVITLTNKEIRVRECVYKSKLKNPSTFKALDISRNYWIRRGIMDWGLVVDADKE